MTLLQNLKVTHTRQSPTVTAVMIRLLIRHRTASQATTTQQKLLVISTLCSWINHLECWLKQTCYSYINYEWSGYPKWVITTAKVEATTENRVILTNN